MNQMNDSILLSRARSRSGVTRRPNMIVTAVLLALLSVIATDSSAEVQEDPLEGINRPIHEFNSFVDAIFFRPLAVTYNTIVPRVIKRGIRNVLSNLDDVAVTANDLLQGNVRQAGKDFSRLAINSTIGIGGLLDVAETAFALQKHDEDFGQTLAHWGMDRGTYIVLPLLGPSTVREGFGGIANLFLNPGFNTDKSAARDKFIALSGMSARADLLGVEDLVVGDEYLFSRGVYLQNLEYRESDGNDWSVFEEF